MTIVEFLEARLAEDESEGRDPFWTTIEGLVSCDRMLLEVEAKRRILAEHLPLALPYWPATMCSSCIDPKLHWPCPTMRALASVYADHPDYRAEWRPE